MQKQTDNICKLLWGPKDIQGLDYGSVLMSPSKYILSLTRKYLEEWFKEHGPLALSKEYRS